MIFNRKKSQSIHAIGDYRHNANFTTISYATVKLILYIYIFLILTRIIPIALEQLDKNIMSAKY